MLYNCCFSHNPLTYLTEKQGWLHVHKDRKCKQISTKLERAKMFFLDFWTQKWLINAIWCILSTSMNNNKNAIYCKSSLYTFLLTLKSCAQNIYAESRRAHNKRHKQTCTSYLCQFRSTKRKNNRCKLCDREWVYIYITLAQSSNLI